VNEQCTVKKSLAVSSKPRGKGRKLRLIGTLTVVELGRFGLLVRGEHQEGWVNAKVLSRRCNKVTQQDKPAEPADIPIEALAEKKPEEAPPPSPPPAALTEAEADTATDAQAPKARQAAESAPRATVPRAPATHELTATNPGQAASLAAQQLASDIEIQLGHPPGPLLLTPPQDIENDAKDVEFIGALTHALAREQGLKLIERESAKAALNEVAIAQGISGNTSTSTVSRVGAEVMLKVSLSSMGDSTHAHVRAIGVSDSALLAAVKVLFTSADDTASEEARSLEVQLRRLGDRLAAGLDGLSGNLRYQRVAVLPFAEQGESTKDRQLGLLVSTELTTVLRRDHGVILIEREQLGSLLDEMAIGQTGVVDPSQAVEVGKLSGAQGLVLGSVAEAGDRYLVNARVVATDSGVVMFADNVPLPAADLVALSSEAVVLRTRTGALYRSLLLPGWGQLYNRQPIKAGIFAGAEVAAIAAAITLHLRGGFFTERYDALGPDDSPEKFERRLERAENAYRWRNISLYVAVGLHLINVLDAFLSGHTYDPAIPGASSAMGFAW
jgi:TolB-like protein